MKEIWKDIEGYEGKYQVSNLGNVKSLNYRGTGKERMLVGASTADGYLAVCLCDGNIQKTFKVHRLVAQAFIENPDNKSCIDHINTVRTDNRAENLCWASQKEICNKPTRRRTTIKVFCEGTIFNSIAECAEHYGVKRITMYKWLDGTNPMPSDFHKKGLKYYYDYYIKM